MADISVLSRLLNGAQRNVDLSTNTLVVGDVKVGGSGGTTLTKIILDALIADYLKVKASATDTTPGFLQAKITAGAALSSSLLNPAGNESLNLDVNVDDSTIEVSSDALRVKDLGITGAKISADAITNVKVASGAAIAVSKLAALTASRAIVSDGSGVLSPSAVTSTELGYVSGVTSAIQTQLDAKVAKAGSTMDSAANISFAGGGEVLGLPATPSAAGAAASKAYVDAVALGLSPKKAVRVATTAAGVLATDFEAGDVIDGVTLAAGNRILLKNQAAAANNGIYVVQASGAPVRATDFDSISPIDEVNGAWVIVQEGTVNKGVAFVQYGTVAVLGTDPINFESYNPLTALIGGDMVTVSGSTITLDLASAGGLESSNPADSAGQLRIKLDGSTLATSASGLKVATSGITTNEINALAVTTAKIAATSVTAAKLGSDVAGSGLTGGNGSAIVIDFATATTDLKAWKATDLAATAGATRIGFDDSVTLLPGSPTTVQAAIVALDSRLDAISSDRVVSQGQIVGEAFAATTLFAVRWAKSGETAGRLYKADNDASSLDKFHCVGIMKTVGALSAAGTAPNVTKLGEMTATAHGLTVGEPVFLGASGALTSTAPSATNTAVVIVGFVKDANTIDVAIREVGVN
jgi:hypothetical protein